MITNRSKTIGALAAVLLTLAATHANASVVSFQNPAGPNFFDWAGGALSEVLQLDVTLPPESQGAFQPWTIGQIQGTDGVGNLSTSSEIQIGGFGNAFAVGVDEGTLVPSGALWGPNGFIFHPLAPPPGTELLEGVETYLGLNLELSPNVFHYGWIGVTRTGNELDAFAWGYETEPGVPIAAGVPEPTTLVLFAVAGSLFIRRRRRFE